MAKLAKNQKAAKPAQPNGLLTTSAKSKVNGFESVNNMPPPARPLDAILSSDAPTPASGKKRKRQRSRKSGVAGSFSDNASSSAIPASSNTVPPSSNLALLKSSTRPTLESLRDSLTQEERTVYEREPEMFGVYAASSDEERASKRPRTREKSLTHSETIEVAEPEEAATTVEDATAEQITEKVHEPAKLADGRFSCPFKDESGCDKTFKDRKGAMKHGKEFHVDADKFKCDQCGAGFSRKEKHDRHVKSHDKPDEETKKAKKTAAVEKVVNEDIVQDEESDDEAVAPEVDRVAETPEPEIELQGPSAESEAESGSGKEDTTSTSNTSPSMTEDASKLSKTVKGQQNQDDENSASEAEGSITVDPTAVVQPDEDSDSSVSDQQVTRVPQKRKRPETIATSNQRARNPRKRARTATPEEDLEVPEQDLKSSDEPASKSVVGDVSADYAPESEPEQDAAEPNNEEAAAESSQSEDDTQTSRLAHQPKDAKPNTRTRKPGSAAQALRRQSSMDSFVSREKNTTGNYKSSSSRAKPASIAAPTRKQTTLAPGGKPSKSVQRSQKGKERAAFSDDEPSDDNLIKRPKPPVKKRKQPQRATTESEESDSDSIGKPAKKVSRRRNDDTAGPREGETGRFTEDEVTTLYSWRDSFCAEHDISPTEFNNMMTASMRRDKLSWPYKYIDKKDFLQQFYEQLPNRNRRSMIRFRERHFQNVSGAKWTEQDDDELKTLVRDMGTKWVDIGQMMDRTADQVSQRWRHKLNYGQDIATGEWSPEEILDLETEVEAYAESKNKSVDDDTLVIPWHAISLKIGNGRTPQQCSNRWRVSTTRRIGGVFVKIGNEDQGERKSIKTPSKTAKRLNGDTGKRTKSKSKKKVSQQDENSEADEPQPTPRPKTRVKQRTPKKAARKSLSEERIMDSSEEADDESEPAEESQKPNGSERQSHISEISVDSEDDAAETDERSADSESQSRQPSPVIPSPSNASSYPTRASQDRSLSPINYSPLSPARNTSKQARSSQQKSSQLKSSQSLPKSTPAQSRNPLKNNRTPGISLTQLHAGTQATSPRNTTGKRSRVPDSVLEERPSPGNSIRRRPVSSPLGMLEPFTDSQKSPLNDGFEHDEKSQQDDSGSESSSQSGDDGSGEDSEEQPEPPKSSFFGSLRGMVFGSSQATPAQKKGRKKLDLMQKVVDSDSDD